MPRRLGFTLVELLVVVTIIVILLALLAPALDRAIEQTERVVCLTRMRGANIATQQYLMENRRVFPGFHQWATTPVDSGPWYARLIVGGYVADAGYPHEWVTMTGAQTGHSPTRYSHPFVCPGRATNKEYVLGNPAGADTPADSASDVPMFQGSMNRELLPEWIAYNAWLGYNSGDSEEFAGPYRTVRLTSLHQPQLTLAFTDGYRWVMEHAFNVRPFMGNGSGIFYVRDFAINRSHVDKHGGGANYSYTDGHGEWLDQKHAMELADRGQTGTGPGGTEYFILPFPHPNFKR